MISLQKIMTLHCISSFVVFRETIVLFINSKQLTYNLVMKNTLPIGDPLLTSSFSL